MFPPQMSQVQGVFLTLPQLMMVKTQAQVSKSLLTVARSVMRLMTAVVNHRVCTNITCIM